MISLGQFLALLALSWALLLFLYLRKPRLVRRVVPYLKAWEELVPATGARRLQRTAATRSWALVRALALATLLALALFDPWSRWRGSAGTSTLLVLDAGAHMRATDETPTRFDRARELARRFAAGRAASDELLVAQLDTALVPLSGFVRETEPLHRAIDRARAGDAPTRLAPAIDFAVDALRGRARPELVLVSDGAVEVEPAALARLQTAGIALRHIALGRSSRNLAIRAFAVRALAWDGARSEALLELENTDTRPATVELRLFEGTTPVDVQRLGLEPRSRTRRFVLLGATGEAFRAELAPVGAPPDDQPLDDRAYAVLAQPPPRRVLLVSAGQRYLESALRLDPRLTLDRIAPETYRSARGYDLAIFDRFAPATPPEAPSLWIAPDGAAGAPFRPAGELERPFFDEIERDAPLLRHVSLRDVNVRKAQRIQPAPRDGVVARSRLGPLIVSGVRAGQPFVALAFDLRESDFVLRTGFPIFLANAVQQLTAARTEVEAPLRVGRGEWRAVAGASAILETPRGAAATLPARAGRVWIRPEEPGFHRLHDGAEEVLLAANPDPDATIAIAPRRIAPAPASALEAAPRPRLSIAPWMLLVAAALALFGFELAFAARGRRA